MKAVYIENFGSDFSLEFREVAELGGPSGGDVVVRVYAAGVSRADLLQARGLYPPPVGVSLNIPGLEFAGEIEAVGRDVTDWKPGDRVFAITAGEAQAEMLAVHSSLLVRMPDGLSFEEAAAVPEAFVTAHDAMVTQAGIRAGDSVLIHAVGSGVGLAGLQIAKNHGCRVVGTSRTAAKLKLCERFGLDLGITVANPPVFQSAVTEFTDGQGADVILDLVGGAYFGENLASLAKRGTLMLVGLTAGANAEFNMGVALTKRARIIGTVLRSRTVEEKAEAMRAFEPDVVPMLSDGRIRPVIDKVFDAGDAMAAYQYLASNKSFGKCVLRF